MSKEVKKIAELMTKKENEKAATIAKFDKELETSRAKLEELKAKLPTGETAEEYKKTLAEIRDYEATIEFFEHKRAEAQELTPAEYMSITKEVKATAEKIKADQGAAIMAEIERLNGLLSEYDADITELNKVFTRAAKLHKCNPMSINGLAVAPINSDAKYYVEAFYKAKTIRAAMYHGVKV